MISHNKSTMQWPVALELPLLLKNYYLTGSDSFSERHQCVHVIITLDIGADIGALLSILERLKYFSAKTYW